MYRIAEYTILFISVMLLQILLFGYLIVSAYAMPLIYLAFLVLLPLDTPPIVMLLMGLITGVVMDAGMGMAGINTITSLFMVFCRPVIVNFALRKTVATHGISVVCPHTVGTKSFLVYTFTFSLIHCFILLSLEALGWSHFGLTLIKVIISAITTTLLVWLIANIFTVRSRKEA